MGFSGLLAGCGTSTTGPRTEVKDSGTSKRFRYGDHSAQFAELRLPDGRPTATVVLLHGGYWLPGYALDLMEPLAKRFTDLGFATWNVEYRPAGEGGGVPTTLTDVAAAVDRLGGGDLPAGLDEDVVLLGHSAGGHLAAWAASRTEHSPGGPPRVRPRGAISLSGVLNLTLASRRQASTSQVTGFVGGTPDEVPEKYAVADPTLLVPAGCPVWAVHAKDDQVVPVEQSTTYVARAKAAGAEAERIDVPGDHFTLIDPGSASFPTIRRLVDQAAG